MVIGQSRAVNIPSLLEHKLAPFPLPILNLDGSITKTTTFLENERPALQELLPMDEHSLW